MLVSRVCEDFGCLPSVAVRELEDDPSHIALAVLDVREYARCKDAYETPAGEKREKALERYYNGVEMRPVLQAVEANATALFVERNPNIRLGHKKA